VRGLEVRAEVLVRLVVETLRDPAIERLDGLLLGIARGSESERALEYIPSERPDPYVVPERSGTVSRWQTLGDLLNARFVEQPALLVGAPDDRPGAAEVAGDGAAARLPIS
jgi:hypothetical protein